MLNKIATASGMILLVSSFALAGQAPPPTAPRTDQRVTTQRQHTQTQTHHRADKKHHKKHKNPDGRSEVAEAMMWSGRAGALCCRPSLNGRPFTDFSLTATSLVEAIFNG